MAFGDPEWKKKYNISKRVLPREKCKIEGCKNVVATHGYCWWHKGYAYKDKAWAKGIKSRGAGTEKLGDKNMELWGFSGQIDLFKHLWATREHRSYLTDEPLGEFNISFFAHLLPKKNYPLYKCNPKNIVFLTFYEHTMLDRGTIKEMEDYCRERGVLDRLGKLWSLRDTMKAEYKELLKTQ